MRGTKLSDRKERETLVRVQVPSNLFEGVGNSDFLFTSSASHFFLIGKYIMSPH